MAPSKNEKSAAGINGRVAGFGLLLELTRWGVVNSSD